LKKIHSSNQSQVFFKVGIPGDAFFFYLSYDHFGICVKDASLKTDSP
jgi:hypothetical protein